jgi:hypothetical protein
MVALLILVPSTVKLFVGPADVVELQFQPEVAITSDPLPTEVTDPDGALPNAPAVAFWAFSGVVVATPDHSLTRAIQRSDPLIVTVMLVTPPPLLGQYQISARELPEDDAIAEDHVQPELVTLLTVIADG